MGKRKWFVDPEVVKIDLSDDEWIKVKKRLTVSEERAMLTAGFKHVHRDAAEDGDASQPSVDIGMDWTAQALARARTYMVDWSATDEEGKSIPLSYEAIKALPPDLFQEIDKAIDRHVEALEQEKKRTDGELKPATISQG
jgi:hypothetical protein